MKSDASIKDLTKMAMMAAIVFVGVYLVKIPTLNGYVHIGDSMIFLSVLILGTKRGAFAGGLGAAISDLLAGYAVYVVPTFIIKFIMAFIMGMFIDKIMPHAKWNWIIGAIVGGIMQCILYMLFEIAMYGVAGGVASFIPNLGQSAVGILIAAILVTVFEKAGVLNRLRSM